MTTNRSAERKAEVTSRPTRRRNPSRQETNNAMGNQAGQAPAPQANTEGARQTPIRNEGRPTNIVQTNKPGPRAQTNNATTSQELEGIYDPT